MREQTTDGQGPVPGAGPAFIHRACYVNHGEHLLNAWNANLIYPEAGYQWGVKEWRKFLHMLKAFGYTNFQYWLMPTMFDLPSLKGGRTYERYAETMREVANLARAEGLEIQCLCSINVWGPKWFYACPSIPEERSNLLKLWRHWMRELSGLDAVTLFPGDLGGCNVNGCTHETAIDLDLEIAGIVKEESLDTRIEIGTWGNPFCGWGGDSVVVPGWNRSAIDLMRSGFYGFTNRDFHGMPDRAVAAFDYLAKRLPQFPPDTIVAINPSLNAGGDGAVYARRIAERRPVSTWDYYVSEGEGSVSPHWNLARIAHARRTERSAAPYIGGICYTMSPMLNLQTLYAGAQTYIDPQADPTELSTRFCASVFGAEHEPLGELMKLFGVESAMEGLTEYLAGVGDQLVDSSRQRPVTSWTGKELNRAFGRMIEHLEAAKPAACTLPIFPDPETYRQDLLWFARKYHEMTGPNPNRALIAWQYWGKTYGIYNQVPLGSLTAEGACRRFADSFAGQEWAAAR